MRVALVYDRVNKIGGAERILGVLHEIWPEAPLYTAVYNPYTAPWAKDFKVIPSFLQKFPFAKTSHEFYPWLTPLAFESFNFDGYDLVISVTSEAAKGIITKPKTLHICYCLTPTRYLWSHYDLYFQNPSFRFLTKPVVSYLRSWDKVAAQRPDYYLAISKEVQGRIKKYYGRNSMVIYPPLVFPAGPVTHAARGPVAGFLPASARSSLNPPSQGSNELRAVESPSTRATPRSSPRQSLTKRYTLDANDYFLIVSRLVPYKRIEIAIEAFNQAGWPLKIVGVGSEETRLRRMAKGNIEFLGNLTDQQVIRYYKNCVALVFPGNEDLGLTILEAQNFGKPVIAFRGGGALETVIEGKTGLFFDRQSADSLIRALRSFDLGKYKSEDCKENTDRFSIEGFKKEFMKFINDKI